MTGLSPKAIAVCAGNRKEPQPRGVEQEHRAPQPVDGGGPPEGDDAGEQRHCPIAPVADRCRRHRADQRVASHALGIARRIRQDQNPEQIEPVPDPSRRAAQRKDEGPQKVEHQQERFHR